MEPGTLVGFKARGYVHGLHIIHIMNNPKFVVFPVLFVLALQVVVTPKGPQVRKRGGKGAVPLRHVVDCRKSKFLVCVGLIGISRAIPSSSGVSSS